MSLTQHKYWSKRDNNTIFCLNKRTLIFYRALYWHIQFRYWDWATRRKLAQELKRQLIKLLKVWGEKWKTFLGLNMENELTNALVYPVLLSVLSNTTWKSLMGTRCCSSVMWRGWVLLELLLLAQPCSSQSCVTWQVTILVCLCICVCICIYVCLYLSIYLTLLTIS